jgi:predicted dehydrogenase
MYRVAVIGCGRGGEGIGGHSIGYAHAQTYQAHPGCQIVGAADISEENLRRFAQTFEVPCATLDYREMLATARPEIVSIAVYAGLHRQMVEACVEAGVRAIWCEKPFALAMDDGRAMVEVCEWSGVRLVVNHQRRYLHAFREAKRLLEEGRIGQLVQYLAAIPDWDLMEWGTHWLDMYRFFSNDQPVRWVMGQVRCTGEKRGYGHVMEEHSLAYICFGDGTRGVLDGGVGLNGEFAMRLVGTEGLIDLYHDGRLSVLNGDGWGEVATRSTLHAAKPGYEAESPWLAVLNALIDWLEGGREPEVAGTNALRTTELYLAAYESALQRDRVDLPMGEQAQFPLEAIGKLRSDTGV